MSIQIDTREKNYVRIVKIFSEIAPDIETTVAKLPLGDYLIQKWRQRASNREKDHI